MPNEHRPFFPVPRFAIPANSIKHIVKNNESWHTLAKQYGLSEEEIIYANFLTLVPEEVNWYLRNNVGCNKATSDGKNWMFSSGLNPGIVWIPPKNYTLDPEVIWGSRPPRYYTVTVHPSRWQPPPGMADNGLSAKKVVSLRPWQHTSLIIGNLTIKGRKQWEASEPAWEKEVIYYNTAFPLARTLKTIVVHHAANDLPVKSVEERQKGKDYAALAYHFFIDRDGIIFEGRPLEIMGGNAGEAEAKGATNDPDWGAIGIVLQGDHHRGDDLLPPSGDSTFENRERLRKQLKSLEDLVDALRKTYPIERLLMHREVTPRKGDPTDCPGDQLVPHVETLRKKLVIPGP